ncbi:MAG: helix-turn-helix domain-containing protein [Opitutales bacterium]|nr:helix-turn-helix domain-containing protein [Opitutales bacterium]
MDQLPAQPNRSLIEGLEVLLAVAQSKEPVRVRQLGRELGMTPTRVQRFLGTLRHLGMVDQHPDRRYGVGSGIHALSAFALSASGLAQQAMRVLPQLDDLEMIVALGVLWRNTVNYFYFNLPGVTASHALGKTDGYPARDSSIGLLLLAQKPPEFVAEFFPDEHEELLPLLRVIAQRGYALITRPEGEASLAVPIGNPPIAGLAVSGQLRDDTFDKVLKRLRETAAQISAYPSLLLNENEPNPLSSL